MFPASREINQYGPSLIFANMMIKWTHCLSHTYLDFAVFGIFIRYHDPTIVDPHGLHGRKQMLNCSNFKPILRKRGAKRRVFGIIDRCRNEVGFEIKIPSSASKLGTQLHFRNFPRMQRYPTQLQTSRQGLLKPARLHNKKKQSSNPEWSHTVSMKTTFHSIVFSSSFVLRETPFLWKERERIPATKILTLRIWGRWRQ